MDNKTKKWKSLSEMKAEVRSKNEARVIEPETDKAEIDRIVSMAERARTSKEFFDLTCRLSSILEKYDDTTLSKLINEKNLYVTIMNGVLHNKSFEDELMAIMTLEQSFSEVRALGQNIDKKTYINSGLSLAFITIAFSLNFLREHNIDFLRKNLTSVVHSYLVKSDYKIDYQDFCYKLETIIKKANYQHHSSARSFFPVQLNDQVLFDNLKASRALAGISFLSLTIKTSLEEQFKNGIRKVEDGVSPLKVLNDIYGSIYRFETSAESYYKGVPESKINKVKSFFNIFIKNNERNLVFFIKKICSGFYENVPYHAVVIDKISESIATRDEVLDFAKQNLKAFHGKIQEDDIEWSNKLFIVSLKTLSLLSELNLAVDKKWSVSTAVFELTDWLKSVHGILNKYFVEDDWSLISPLVMDENVEIEWKSSFFIPISQHFTDKEAETEISKKLFGIIIKTIIGMLNTAGGTLIVGLVENFQDVVREDVLRNIIHKNGRSFFDIGYEMEQQGRNLDSIRLQIFQHIKNQTDSTAEKFNDLIDLQPIFLSHKDRRILIVKIDIKKAPTPFYTIKKESATIWASLIKRAHGQTIEVDIRDYL